MKDTTTAIVEPASSDKRSSNNNKAKMPDPRGQRLLSSFFTVIAASEKFKHFETLFEKFEWERKERLRKEEERYSHPSFHMLFSILSCY